MFFWPHVRMAHWRLRLTCPLLSDPPLWKMKVRLILDSTIAQHNKKNILVGHSECVTLGRIQSAAISKSHWTSWHIPSHSRSRSTIDKRNHLIKKEAKEQPRNVLESWCTWWWVDGWSKCKSEPKSEYKRSYVGKDSVRVPGEATGACVGFILKH